MIPIALSLIALITFAILDTYSSLNVALFATIAITILEVAYTIFTVGTLDSISVLSIGLVFALVTLSKIKKNRILFKLKPAILNAGLGFYLVGAYALGHPILLLMSQKYKAVIPEYNRIILATPQGQALLVKCSLTIGLGLIIHGAWVGYTSVKHSNFWWAVTNSLGLIATLFLATLATVLL
jgi:intracellular septation protein A